VKKNNNKKIIEDIISFSLAPLGVKYSEVLNWKKEDHDGLPWFQYYRTTHEHEQATIEYAKLKLSQKNKLPNHWIEMNIDWFMADKGLMRFDEKIEPLFEENALVKNTKLVLEEGKRPEIIDNGYTWDAPNVAIVPSGKEGKWDFVVNSKASEKYNVKSAGELSPKQILVHIREYSKKKRLYHK